MRSRNTTTARIPNTERTQQTVTQPGTKRPSENGSKIPSCLPAQDLSSIGGDACLPGAYPTISRIP